MAKKKNNDDPNSKTICKNRKAFHDYEILDQLECGIALRGSEVKSLRNGKMSIDEAFARIRDNELWLVGSDIPIYPQATYLNHEPKRPRKLLLRKRELHKFAEEAGHKGLTMIPLSVYFSKGLVKVNVAIAKGKKLLDKRESLKKKDDTREMRNAMLKRQ
ncbi:MAG: SsrA-binding protein SmpB [Planctomycetota bacterium]|nr:SsrA-binding protein SmpB [Planctomycetota bacterium]MDA1212600.1 SsrA-binding protein SmpB [Planctomycetota bacterium]